MPAAKPAAVEAWFRPRLTSALLSFLRQSGADPGALAQPPLPEREECRAYCPRCRGQYVVPDGLCSPCELPLRRFADEPASIPWPVVAAPEVSVAPQPVVEAKPAAQPVVARARKRKRKRR
jgi:hypothetical protein